MAKIDVVDHKTNSKRKQLNIRGDLTISELSQFLDELKKLYPLVKFIDFTSEPNVKMDLAFTQCFLALEKQGKKDKKFISYKFFLSEESEKMLEMSGLNIFSS